MTAGSDPHTPHTALSVNLNKVALVRNTVTAWLQAWSPRTELESLRRQLLLSREDAEMVAKHLYRQGRLTPQVLFRALCAGDLELFVAGMAARCGAGKAAVGCYCKAQ